MLRACWRVLRPGGRTAFYTIFIPSGLSDKDYRRAARSRSRVTSWRREHPELLSASGFSNVEEIDLTDEFLRVAQAWLEARERHADELTEVEGQADFAQRLKENKISVAALRDGLLRRSLFVAQRPR